MKTLVHSFDFIRKVSGYFSTFLPGQFVTCQETCKYTTSEVWAVVWWSKENI